MLKMFRAPLAVLLLTVSFFASPAALAADKKDGGPREDADICMRVGMMLIREAQDLRKSSPTPKGLVTTAALFNCAGQLFEIAERNYKALLPQKKATQRDIDSAHNALKLCVANAQQIKQNFSKIKP